MARSSRRDETREGGRDNSLVVALGAAGGMALGLWLTNLLQGEPVREGAARLRDRAREAARGWGPAPLRRPDAEEAALIRQEDAVLDAFLRDPVLAERGIDVGCISPGIIELTGTVRTADEGERAVRAARGVDGVGTVVNRMDVDDGVRSARRPPDDAGDDDRMGGEWTGRRVGMGQRRQGIETENRGGLDDSQHLRELALEASDLRQYEDEDIAHSRPLVGSRPGPGDAFTRYRPDELDNQDPVGRRAASASGQPQAMHSQARVGGGIQPGIELALEQEHVPVKPHSASWAGSASEDGDAV